jgi:hypothetical protein
MGMRRMVKTTGDAGSGDGARVGRPAVIGTADLADKPAHDAALKAAGRASARGAGVDLASDGAAPMPGREGRRVPS